MVSYCFEIHTPWTLYLFPWIKLNTLRRSCSFGHHLSGSALMYHWGSPGALMRVVAFYRGIYGRLLDDSPKALYFQELPLSFYYVTDWHTKLPPNGQGATYLLLLGQLKCMEKVQMLPLFAFCPCVVATQSPYNLRGGRWSLYVAITYQRATLTFCFCPLNFQLL